MATKLLKHLMANREAVKDHAKKVILKRDREFKKHSGRTAKVKPIRHPNGKSYRGADYAFLWGDAIWCGEEHLETMQLYLDFSGFRELADDREIVRLLDEEPEAVDLYTDLWNETLKEALPQVYWCELGCELGDKPKTPQEEIWFKIACGEIDADGTTDDEEEE